MTIVAIVFTLLVMPVLASPGGMGRYLRARILDLPAFDDEIQADASPEGNPSPQTPSLLQAFLTSGSDSAQRVPANPKTDPQPEAAAPFRPPTSGAPCSTDPTSPPSSPP